MGIFDLFQLSQVQIRYNAPMLWTIFYFWAKTTNNFHLRYRMIGLTFFNLVIMIGLRLTRELLVPTTHLSGEYTICYNDLSYNNFTENNFDDSTTKVSPSEHVSFLTF